MEEKAKFRFAVMGAGHISHKFCDAVSLIDECEITAIASRDLKKARKVAHKYGIAAAYDSYEQMLIDEKPDAVYISVTTNAHYDLAMLCMAHDTPILCEKAMFRSACEAEDVFRHSKEQGIFAMEAMWSLFLPNIRQARQWIEEGKIGDITLGRFDIGFQAEKNPKNRFYNPDLGGGACYDILVYAYDILTWLIGQPVQGTSVQAVYTNDGVDKTDIVQLEFPDCMGVLTATFEANLGDQEQAVVYGSRGKIVIPHAHHGKECCLYVEGEEPVTWKDDKTINGFVYEIQEVMSYIERGEIESSTVPHEMTMRTSLLFDKIYE